MNKINCLKTSMIFLAIMTVLCGVIYVAAVTLAAGMFFSNKSTGSMVTAGLKDGTKITVGSELIGQEFTDQKYLIGRPQGVTNLSPASRQEQLLIEQRIRWWHDFDPANNEPIPIDLLTCSASGCDPNISLAAAEYQVARISKVRAVDEAKMREVIKKHTTGRFLGIFGEPSVNVLKANLAFDGLG